MQIGGRLKRTFDTIKRWFSKEEKLLELKLETSSRDHLHKVMKGREKVQVTSSDVFLVHEGKEKIRKSSEEMKLAGLKENVLFSGPAKEVKEVKYVHPYLAMDSNGKKLGFIKFFNEVTEQMHPKADTTDFYDEQPDKWDKLKKIFASQITGEMTKKDKGFEVAIVDVIPHSKEKLLKEAKKRGV